MRKWRAPICAVNHAFTAELVRLLLLVCISILAVGCPGGSGGGHHVKVISSALPMPVGASETFSASSSHPSDNFTWTSSDEGVATVSAGGTVLAVGKGSATIRAEGSDSGMMGTANLTVVSPGSSTLIWDGESGWTGTYGSLNTSRPFSGSNCFEGVPDPYHSPTVDLSGYSSYRLDISGLDEIWFLASVSEAGKTFSFDMYGWPNTSNSVPLNNYVEGSALDTSWRVVRIPIADLVNQNFGLEKIERMSFGVANPTEGHSIFVDEVWAVDLDAFTPGAIPLMGSVTDVDFGNVAVQGAAYRDITLSNIGTGTLSINQISVTGEYTEEFLVSLDPFSIAPGGTHTLSLTFAPETLLGKTDGNTDASLVLTHDLTPMGSTTTVPLAGRAVGPAITVTSDALNFGGVPNGLTATRTLVVTNPGNLALQVSSVSASDLAFQAAPASFNIAAGASQSVSVAFTPSAISSYDETLTILSNAIGDETRSVDLSAIGLAAGAMGSLPVAPETVTSSTVALSWPDFGGVASVKVYLGPEPSAIVDDGLPTQVLIATLGGGVSTYTAEDLAPSVDTFFHVESLDGGGSVVAQGNAHARTVGGPGAALDGPVREVHMIAPNIIQVVVADLLVHSYSDVEDLWDQGVDELVGYTGPDLQGGTWTVRRKDGSLIQVLNVHRDSVPVGNNYYEIGWQATPRDNKLDVDHRIYLELASSVGGPEILSIEGPQLTYDVMDLEVNRSSKTSKVDFVLPFSDRYLETPAVQLNQVGYSPRATERWAYVSGWIGDGGPLSLDGFPANAGVLVEPDDPMLARQAVVSGLPITLRAAFDDDSGTEVREIDISSVPASEGTVFRVHIPGVGVSWPTQVSESAVFKSFYATTRGLYFNRWGRDLQTQYTEWAPRPPDHGLVFTAESNAPLEFFSTETPLTGARFLAGGHHDAGDFDIRVFHTGFGMALLGAYEVNADLFTDDQLTIPESGNGIPDLLDEIIWNLTGWAQLQEADGGVRMGVESFRHPWGLYYADIETPDLMPYWTYSRDPIHTIKVAAMFAQVSRLVAPFDQSISDEFRTRALMAYDYALSHGVSETTGGPLMYAWSELYRLTGEQQYRNQFDSLWQANDPYGAGMDLLAINQWMTSFLEPSQPTFVHMVTGYLGAAGIDPTIYSQAVTKFTGFANEAADDVENLHAHRNGRIAGLKPDWGAGTAQSQWLFRIHARQQLGDLSAAEEQKYFNAISMSSDYVLGANPLGMSWITGLGSRTPQDPLHADALSFKKDGLGLMPGIPVYGPVEELSAFSYYDYGENVMYPAFALRPLMRRYADIHTFVTNNELDVGVQASHAELFSRLIADDMSPPNSWLPGGSEHRSPLAPR